MHAGVQWLGKRQACMQLMCVCVCVCPRERTSSCDSMRIYIRQEKKNTCTRSIYIYGAMDAPALKLTWIRTHECRGNFKFARIIIRVVRISEYFKLEWEAAVKISNYAFTATIRDSVFHLFRDTILQRAVLFVKIILIIRKIRNAKRLLT